MFVQPGLNLILQDMCSLTTQHTDPSMMQESMFSYGQLWFQNLEIHSDSYRQNILGVELAMEIMCTNDVVFDLRIWGTLPRLHCLRKPLSIKQLKEALARTGFVWLWGQYVWEWVSIIYKIHPPILMSKVS